MTHRNSDDSPSDPAAQARLRTLAQWSLLIAGVVGMVSFGVSARTDGVLFVITAVLALASALLAGAAGMILCDLWPLSDRSDPPEENQS